MFFGAGEQFRSANGGTRFTERYFIRVHDAQSQKPKIAHGARGRAQVERVARSYQDHAQPVEFIGKEQECYFTRWVIREMSRLPSGRLGKMIKATEPIDKLMP